MDLIVGIIQDTYISATVLLMVALGGLFSEKSGVTNIALEGIMIIGGFVGIGTLQIIESPNINPQLLFLSHLRQGGFYMQIYGFVPQIVDIITSVIIYVTAISAAIALWIKQIKIRNRTKKEN
jgi:ABC-type uncharacterized transport system permease subunit